ncbi:ephrin_rec_like domain-containing protein [Nephila pilipes]|uniref:Ephrin_rec_like domain-containing protein n=1 Tax=Nephila pilipes TaxID=299642 RepID=A0A8X6UAK2_NEPPI|nr:ephrin_rec_like domain-containing protein [Nephila pilipes]
MLLIHISSELRLELSLNDYNKSRTQIKLVCEPSKATLQNAKEHKILWKGSKFGMRERDKLRERLPGNVYFPDINVNSPQHYHCYLMSPKSYNEDYNFSKRRSHREVPEFLPAQFGSCFPGYRIEQDRCFPCAPGSFTSGQESSCRLCPKDFYIEIAAADSCWPCPEGKKTITEGADSEDLCVYIDTSGRAVETPSTKLLVIGICAAIFIVTAWILITVYLTWWCKGRGSKVNKMEQGTLARSSAEDHIYAEIQGIDDATEPEHPSEEPIYTEIIASDEGYEKPISPSEGTIYTELDNEYEEPKRGNKDNIYTEIIPSEHEYETIQDPEDDKVSDQSLDRSRSSQSQTFRSGPRTSKDYYETPIAKQTNDTSNTMYPVFLTKRSHHFLPKTKSSGFQPLLPSAENPKEKVGKSEYDELAEIILKTSKNNSASNKLPNLEEMGYDVEKLSKLIKDLSTRAKKDEKAINEKNAAKNPNVSDRRHHSESLPKAPRKRSSAKETSPHTIRKKD